MVVVSKASVGYTVSCLMMFYTTAPCDTNPCLNYGQCISFDDTVSYADLEDFQCVCQPPYDGQYCEMKANPCVWPQSPGICDQNLLRYYYDPDIQECLPFNYTGILQAISFCRN